VDGSGYDVKDDRIWGGTINGIGDVSGTCSSGSVVTELVSSASSG
jgi:hypothetical protein